MSKPHGNQRVSDNEIITAIEEIEEDEPVASAAEIAEKVNMTRTGVNARLKALKAQGHIDKKSVGRGYVWWTRD